MTPAPTPPEWDERTPQERAHDALVENLSIHMAPDTLRLIVDTVLEGQVSAAEAQRRYEAGRREIREQYDIVTAAAETLRDVHELAAHALSWSGRPGWRTDVLRRIDDLRDRLPEPD